MQAIQTIGIDLPLKAPVWRTQRATHGFPTMIPNRYGLDREVQATVSAMAAALNAVARAATTSP
jgi:hypothetical protein